MAAVALGYLITYVIQNGQELADADLELDVVMVAVSVAVLFVYLIGRVLAWHQITVHMGARIPLQAATASWFVSLLGKYIPGKVFLLLGRLELYSEHGQSKARTTLAFTVETVVSMLSSVYTILLALLFVEVDLVQRWRIPLIGLLIALSISLHPSIMRGLLRLAGRLTRRQLPEVTVRYREMLLFTAVGTGVWLIFGVAFYLFINALYAVPPQYVIYLAGSISAASLLGILAVLAPAGLGVREGFLTLLLSQIMPAPVAAVVALGSRVWVTLAELVVIAVGAGMSRSARRRLAGPVAPVLSTDSNATPTGAPDE